MTRAQQPYGDRTPDLQLHPDVVTSTGDFSDIIGGDCWVLSPMWEIPSGLGRSAQPQTSSLSLPPQAWWGALRGQPSSFPPHPGLAMGQDPRWGRCGAGGVSSSVVEPRHPNRGEHPDRRASLCRPFPLACWAGASLTEVPAVPGGLRQPCGAIRGQRFCPQLAQGQAEPAAEGQAPKQTSISLCPPGQVSQTGSVGTSQPHHPLGPIRVFCGWEERK